MCWYLVEGAREKLGRWDGEQGRGVGKGRQQGEPGAERWILGALDGGRNMMLMLMTEQYKEPERNIHMVADRR